MKDKGVLIVGSVDASQLKGPVESLIPSDDEVDFRFNLIRRRPLECVVFLMRHKRDKEYWKPKLSRGLKR